MFDNTSFFKATLFSVAPILLLVFLVAVITYEADRQHASPDVNIVQKALDQGIDPLTLIEATAAGVSSQDNCQTGAIESPEENINGKQYLRFYDSGKNYLKIYTDTPTYTQQHAYQTMTADVVSLEQKLMNKFNQLESTSVQCERRDIYLSIAS